MRDDLNRAAKAAELLAEPLLVEALDAIETEITTKWKSNANPDARESLWNLMQAQRLFKTALQKHITTGKLVSLTPKPSLPQRLGGAISSLGSRN